MKVRPISRGEPHGTDRRDRRRHRRAVGRSRLAAAGRRCHHRRGGAAPGGKMRRSTAAGPVDAGPTVLTMRGVFDALFADAGTALDDHVTLSRQTMLARHWWPGSGPPRSSCGPARSAEAIARLRRRARARDDSAASAAVQTRLFAAFDGPMMQAAEPDTLLALRPASCAAGLLPSMAPWPDAWPRPRAAVPRPAAAPAVRALRHLCRRLALASPALLSLIWHAEAPASGAVEGGMHALAQAMAELVEHARRTLPLWRAGRADRDPGSGGVTRCPAGGRPACPRPSVVFNGDPRALSPACSARHRRPPLPARVVEPRSLSAHVWTFAPSPPGPDLAHHNVFFGADPEAEFGTLAEGRLPEDPTLYICAQDRGTANDAACARSGSRSS